MMALLIGKEHHASERIAIDENNLAMTVAGMRTVRVPRTRTRSNARMNTVIEMIGRIAVTDGTRVNNLLAANRSNVDQMTVTEMRTGTADQMTTGMIMMANATIAINARKGATSLGPISATNLGQTNATNLGLTSATSNAHNASNSISMLS